MNTENAENELGSWTGEASRPASLPSSPVSRAKVASQQGEEPGQSAQPAGPESSESQQGELGGSGQLPQEPQVQQHTPPSHNEEGQQGPGHQQQHEQDQGQGPQQGEQDQQQQQDHQQEQGEGTQGHAPHSQPEPPDKPPPQPQGGSEASKPPAAAPAAFDQVQTGELEAEAGAEGREQAGPAAGEQRHSSAGGESEAGTRGPQPPSREGSRTDQQGTEAGKKTTGAGDDLASAGGVGAAGNDAAASEGAGAGDDLANAGGVGAAGDDGGGGGDAAAHAAGDTSHNKQQGEAGTPERAEQDKLQQQVQPGSSEQQPDSDHHEPQLRGAQHESQPGGDHLESQPGSDHLEPQPVGAQHEPQPVGAQHEPQSEEDQHEPQPLQQGEQPDVQRHEQQAPQQQEQPDGEGQLDKAGRHPVAFSEAQHPGEGHAPADEEFTARAKARISFFGEANEVPVEASPLSSRANAKSAFVSSGRKDHGSKLKRPASAEHPTQSHPSTSQDRTSPQGDSDDIDKDTKHLVPFHLVDSSQNLEGDLPPPHLRRQISKQPSRQNLGSQHSHEPSPRGKQRPSQTTEPGWHLPFEHLQMWSGQKGPLRPSSDSHVLPFQQLKPPKLPSRPGSHRPQGPFGIRGFHQQQQQRSSSAGSQGYSGSDMSQHTDNHLPLASVMAKGQATKGETPADYMRGHAAGAASRGASKRWQDGANESRRWSRWGHESNKSRWEEESVAAGMGGSVAQPEEKPHRVFRVAKLGGHTAGVGGHAAKLAELGLMQQQAEQDELYQQPSLQDLVTVKTVNHGDRAVKVDQAKPRRPGHLISNLRGRLPGTMLNKDKEGQTRRLMAAAQNMYGPQPMKRKYIPRPPTPEGITLDGFLMLEAGNDELPEGVVVARLPSRNISNVEVADMTYFTALKLLDLADNRIPDMNMLAPLIGIRALSLAMNKLGPLPMGGMLGEVGASAFQQLSTLDLSYNNLDTHATLGPLSPLARLPSLCELNLSGNKWRKLPDTLGPFTALELLKLAENSLTGTALTPLATLPSLKVLGLSRNQIMGLPGLDGTEHNLEEGLMTADLDAHTSFKALHTLDLSNNRVESEDRVKPLQLLPSLRSVLLAGNPLAAKQFQAARRTNQRREYLKARAEKGDVPGPELLEAPQPKEALWVYEPSGHPGPKPSVGRVLAGTGGHFVAIHEPLQRRDAEKAATLAAVTANVPDEALTEAFERTDAAMEVWQLNTVPEEEEGEQESEQESDNQPDGTFLTGVGITEKLPKAPKEEPEGPQEPAEQEPSEHSSHGMWEEVSDPTERLALALGLDPAQLAVHTGIPTTDATGSVNALRYALAHPLVELKEGLGPAPKHLETTAAARAKQRPRLQPLAQGPGPTFATAFGRTQAANPQRLRFRTQAATTTTPKIAPEASQTLSEGSAGHSNRPFPTDPRTVRVQHVEGMLTGMRSRLDALEGTLKQQLTKLPPEITSKAQRSLSRRMTRSRSPSQPCSPSGPRSRSPTSPGSQPPARPLSPFTADMSVDTEDDEDEDDEQLEPDSPSSPSGRWPQQSGKFDLERAGSDVSSLPDEVVDAIENSDPSASSGESDTDNKGGAGASRRRSSSPTQHGLRLQLPSPVLRAQKQRQGGNHRYSAGPGRG